MGGASSSAASLLLAAEDQGLALDFTDSFWQANTGFYGSARIKDTTTPANNYNSSPTQAASSLLTYTSPSLKMTRGPAGLLRFGAHNLCLQSETFTTTWTKTVAGDTVGTNSLIPAASSGLHQINQSITTIAGFGYSVSAEMKANGVNFGYVDFFAGSAGQDNLVVVDLTDGTYSGYFTGGVNPAGRYTIEGVGDGWYRVTISTNATGTSGAMTIGARQSGGNFG
jgi:hypothetical protein